MTKSWSHKRTIDGQQGLLMKNLLMICMFLTFACTAAEKAVRKPAIKHALDLEMKEVVEPKAEQFLQEMAKKIHFTGAALVMHKDEVIHAKGYGNATPDKANTVNTAFHVASITKQFTAAAILQLSEKNILKLNGTINSYLPQKYRSSKWDDVTVHNLLSHTSGIPDYAVTRDYYHVEKGFCLGNTVDGMISEAMAKDLEFSPGTKFAYSNLGYTLLGEIIENLSGMAYDKYLQEYVFMPMGMNNSKVHIEGHVPSACEAQGYRFSQEQQKQVPDDEISLPVTAPDGGLITTLGDFVKWIKVYKDRGSKVLKPESVEKMMSPFIKTGWDGPAGILNNMGYGLFLGNSSISHMGEIVGFKSYFVLDRARDVLVVVFANNTTTDPIQVAIGLMKTLGYLDV